MNELGKKFVIGTCEVYREFDATNFKSNTNFVTGGSKFDIDSSLNTKLRFYTTMLNKSSADLSEISIDRLAVKKFISSYKSIEYNNVPVRNIEFNDVSKVNSVKIMDYLQKIEDVMNQIVAGENYSPTVDSIFSGEATLAVKKDIVATTIDPSLSLRKLATTVSEVKVPCTLNYVKNSVIPFIKNFDQKKLELQNELSETIANINMASNKLTTAMKVVNDVKHGGNLDKETSIRLSEFSYRAFRSLLDIVSYTSYMMIRKVDTFIGNTIACNTMYSDVVGPVLTESDDRIENPTGVISSYSSDISDDFVKGNISAFAVLANNIYELNVNKKGNTADTIDIAPTIGDIESNPDGSYEQGYVKYDTKPFDEAIKVYIEIGQGLDNIAAHCDEYLMIFDDIINSSGFSIPLDERYRGRVGVISDVSDFYNVMDIHPDGAIDIAVYHKIVDEVHDYPDQMQKIADIALDVKTRIDSLKQRLDDDINCEFKSLKAVMELKTWLDDFLLQYAKLNTIITSAFMSRLRMLGDVLSKMNATQTMDNNLHDGDSLVYDVESSIENLLFESMMDMEDLAEEELVFTLENEYYKAKYRNILGVELVTEADTSINNNAKTTTTTTTITNTLNKAKDSAGGFINKLTELIKKFFNDLKNKFNTSVTKLISNSDKYKNVIANLGVLEGRSYNNVQINNFSPYHKFPYTRIVTDMESMKKWLDGAVTNIKASIQNSDENTIKNNMFSFIDKFDGTKEITSKELVNYYKFGSFNIPENVTVANGELKSIITTEYIPFVKDFQNNTYVNNILTQVEEINKSLEALVKACNTVESTPTTPNAGEKEVITASYKDIAKGSLISEAEESQTADGGKTDPNKDNNTNNQNTNQGNKAANDANKNTLASMKPKLSTIKAMTCLFTGSICMAINPRLRYYVDRLSDLIPKNANTQTVTTTQTTQTQTNNQSEATAAEETNT